MFKTKSKIRFIRSLLNIVVARFTMRINFPNDRIAHRSLMRYIWKRDERVSIRKRRDLPGSKYRRVQHCSILTRFFPYRRCVYFSNEKLAWAWKCTIPRKPIPVVCLTRCIRASFAIPPLFREQGIFVLVEILDG